MSDKSVNGPVQSSNAITAWVWYIGTDKVRKGEAFCYDVAHGTATGYDGRRHNYVARPASTNAGAFAGVAARDYIPSGTGQLVELYLPGSKGVEVAIGANTTINSGILTFQVGGGNGSAGRFVKGGYAGAGSIVPRQTTTAILASSFVCGFSLAVDMKTLTITSTAGLVAGDVVIILGGEDTGSSKAIIPGRYTIKSVTSATVVVLDRVAAGATPSGALKCSGYIFKGNATCQADLLEGDESGGVEFYCPPATGATGAFVFSPVGVTYILGGVTVASADADGTLANGTFYGQKKGFVCLGTLTTKDVIVLLATAGIQSAVTVDSTVGTPTALASAAFDAAAETLFVEWLGVWIERAHVGSTLAAS